jgi:hypothetical protein
VARRWRIPLFLRGLFFFGLAFAVTLGVAVWPRWVAERDATIALAEAHRTHAVAHPGWSFPARIWSAPASVELPKERRLAHAKARGYTEACPPTEPGSFCAKTGDVKVRGSVVPAGRLEASGAAGAGPLDFEPVLLGWLVGPDAEIRVHLPLAEAPPHLIAALLAAEDQDYESHRGVNLRGVARAAWVNLSGKGMKQGASTITMQVVRNLSQRKDKTLQRKLQEMMAAVALDSHLGKDGVLQMYLDAPYLGQDGSFSICGFQAAAFYYYGKDARSLSLGEAATLASILPAPARFAPDRAPEEAKARRDRTLRAMQARGWDAAAVEAALAEPVVASPHHLPEPVHPAYLQATRAWLEQSVGPAVLYGAGLEVHTAMDLVAQTETERLLPERVAYLEKVVGRNGKEPLQTATVLIEPSTGYLVASYGGSQVLPTDFSRATQAKRQSGSSIKPMVYALAFSQVGSDGKPAWKASDTVPNEPRTFPGTNGWRPRNISGDYSVTSALAQGLAWSQNVATASLLEKVGGPPAFITFAQRFGFDTALWPAEMGLALGQGEVTPLEMGRFVGTVLAGGTLVDGRPVVQAVDAAGQVRVSPQGSGERVISREAAAHARPDAPRGRGRHGRRGARGRRPPGLQRPRRRQDRHDRQREGPLVRRGDGPLRGGALARLRRAEAHRRIRERPRGPALGLVDARRPHGPARGGASRRKDCPQGHLHGDGKGPERHLPGHRCALLARGWAEGWLLDGPPAATATGGGSPGRGWPGEPRGTPGPRCR